MGLRSPGLSTGGDDGCAGHEGRLAGRETRALARLALAPRVHSHPRMDSLEASALEAVAGGMRTDGFRRSTNIEDRRPPEAIAEDERWWKSIHGQPSQPQPQPRTFDPNFPWSPFPPMVPIGR